MKIDVERLADRWIAERLDADSALNTDNETAEDVVLHLPYESPEAAWVFVERVFTKTQSIKVLGLLGAGVLEELIAVDSANAVSQLRKLIERHPIVAEVLHGVWQGDTPDSVWQEIVNLRSA